MPVAVSRALEEGSSPPRRSLDASPTVDVTSIVRSVTVFQRSPQGPGRSRGKLATSASYADICARQ
jgi:hypothetical protein